MHNQKINYEGFQILLDFEPSISHWSILKKDQVIKFGSSRSGNYSCLVESLKEKIDILIEEFNIEGLAE